MTATLQLQQFNNYYTLYGPRTNNTIVQNSNYISLKYSTEICSFNNITLMFTLQDFTIDEYFNKYKCDYKSSALNELTMNKLLLIEKQILHKFKQKTSSSPVYKLENQLKDNSRLKLFSTKHTRMGAHHKQGTFLLKISGIWETSSEYGIIYKFYSI